MKILKNGITRLASLSRISLQVITELVYLPGREPDEYKIETVNIPDEWVLKLQPGSLKVCSFEEVGFYYLTEIGWEANKEVIKEIYVEAMKFQPYTTDENTWLAYEKYAKNHFSKFKENNNIKKVVLTK